MKHNTKNHPPEPPPMVSQDSTPDSTNADSCLICAARGFGDAIHLDSCFPFEHLAVRTQRSDYELVVLPGSAGEVLVRGGRYFKEFGRACVVGSTFGGSAIRIRTIEVGCPLELHVDGTRIVTSTIEAVSRVENDGSGHPAM